MIFEYYSTTKETLLLLAYIESALPVEYAQYGTFTSIDDLQTFAINEDSDIWTAKHGTVLSDGYYLMLPQGQKMNDNIVHRRPTDLEAVRFNPSRTFGSNCLLEGIFDTAYPNTFTKEVFQIIRKYTRKHFILYPHRNAWLSPIAFEYLNHGWRLTNNANNNIYDLEPHLTPNSWLKNAELRQKRRDKIIGSDN